MVVIMALGMNSEEPCAYCAKWFPRSKMKQLPDEYPNWYCPDCYPEVLKEHWKLPNKYFEGKDRHLALKYAEELAAKYNCSIERKGF
jgi:hypothetical protein